MTTLSIADFSIEFRRSSMVPGTSLNATWSCLPYSQISYPSLAATPSSADW